MKTEEYMTRSEFITIINDINDKFKAYSSEKNVDKVHFDVLHMALSETIYSFSEEWVKHKIGFSSESFEV